MIRPQNVVFARQKFLEYLSMIAINAVHSSIDSRMYFKERNF